MAGKSWKAVREKQVMTSRLFTKTVCGITKNGDNVDLIQMQWLCGEYKLGSGKVIGVQPLPLSASKSANTTPDKDEVIEGFGDMMLDSTVNSGGEEMVEDDDEGRVEDDGYGMAEEIDGADFEYIK